MKKWLRYQISGTTCILYTCLILLPYIKWDVLCKYNIRDVAVLFAFIIAAVGMPLGVIIHEISISLLPPFKENRRIEFECFKKLYNNSNNINPADRVISKSLKISWNKAGDICKKELESEYIRNTLSNRISYCYVRTDAGIFSALASIIIVEYLHLFTYKNEHMFFEINGWFWWIIPVILLFVSLLMLLYMPVLYKEIDDIEKELLTYLPKKNL